MIKKAIATAGIALLALFAVPTAATAATYVPSSAVSVSDTTPAPGQPVNISIAPGSFTPGETITFSLTGENGAGATLAAITTATLTKAADADGSADVTVTLPANATGSYSLTATGATSGNVATATLTVAAADGLPVTGAEVSAGVIWIAGGALVLGAVLLAVVGLRRRAASQK